ncbi:hypothetical protein TREMEDRAFT_29861 [Tremella mesenterica DSM 1558]|uniref:uncharacterized protein n=1 Tax=Tremella mesenterica (strain ATCC 24925 / CBS 8224 / DSM 1558 / NBRC 9311 / NRRL Y-6157 / RJB 2259-6 / UBC 559-6) TaxID=578456 RepID=UPI0003F49E7B|nr:uncharacterized protein TREMEDRAFT_29861 [Tremella mesenterica DSM 1558]EIW70220.1 hypothetical protein TREMEDRAFT_29861 [Tremella mesenterica DSM 1558]
MSSLTESTIALPMGDPKKRVQDRLSTRHNIQLALLRAESAYTSGLQISTRRGKVEDIRQALVSLALLGTFQTSLGMGSGTITNSVASMLAYSPSLTLSREIIAAIDMKFPNPHMDDMIFPSISALPPSSSTLSNDSDSESESEDRILRQYWTSVRERYATGSIIDQSGFDLSILPPEWAVISINVTDDRNTMFVTRHQKDHEPLVFCLPLDRQGRREGDDDLFTFDAAISELKSIIEASDQSARSAKDVADTTAAKKDWWAVRQALDRRMKTLVETIEFCWLGAFKTIFSSRQGRSTKKLKEFRTKLDRIFAYALSGNGIAISKHQVHLDDALLECFITLSSKSRDEEIEDLVYFILDIYQFHGVPVALAELDIDQIGVDVKSLLAEIDTTNATPTEPEHLFLALDKNVFPIPWESLPILRGRPISRIPSLPFLLDQVNLGLHLHPGSDPAKRSVNSKKTFYILNPSGDLKRTQESFEPWIDSMTKRSGWKGIKGRPPTELEYTTALKENDLVLYFGHGGAEQYVRSKAIAHLPKCASVMLWGCSSGELRDAGDLDRYGTPWDYVMGGCPSLVANLWDVTDKEIDHLSTSVFQRLHLNPSHVSTSRKPALIPLAQISNVQAVNSARDDCKLCYLTGAAPVVYGVPIWVH